MASLVGWAGLRRRVLCRAETTHAVDTCRARAAVEWEKTSSAVITAPATIHSQIYSESANIVIISLSALRRHQLGPLVLASLRSAKNRRRFERKSIIAFGTCCRRPVNQCVARRRRYKSGIGGRRLYVTTSNRRHWLPTVADSLSRCENY